MKRDDLKKLVEGITDDQISAILDINSADIGKAKGDAEKLKDEIPRKDRIISEYETKNSDLEKDIGDSQKLKDQISSLQKEIDDRKAADTKAAEEAAVAERFKAAMGDKSFINDFTKAGILAEFTGALAKEENKGKSDADVFSALVKDRDGLFTNPNPLDSSGGPGKPGGGPMDDNAVRAVMGLPPKKE